MKITITLSRHFDENVEAVAGMCPKCYRERDEVKIVAVNDVFLRWVAKRSSEESEDFVGKKMKRDAVRFCEKFDQNPTKMDEEISEENLKKSIGSEESAIFDCEEIERGNEDSRTKGKLPPKKQLLEEEMLKRTEERIVKEELFRGVERIFDTSELLLEQKIRSDEESWKEEEIDVEDVTNISENFASRRNLLITTQKTVKKIEEILLKSEEQIFGCVKTMFVDARNEDRPTKLSKERLVEEKLLKKIEEELPKEDIFCENTIESIETTFDSSAVCVEQKNCASEESLIEEEIQDVTNLSEQLMVCRTSSITNQTANMFVKIEEIALKKGSNEERICWLRHDFNLNNEDQRNDVGLTSNGNYNETVEEIEETIGNGEEIWNGEERSSKLRNLLKKKKNSKISWWKKPVEMKIEATDQPTISSRRRADNEVKVWTAPLSPHNLVEEALHSNPWGLLVATIFLNKTSCCRARPYIDKFLEDHPGPASVLVKKPEDLEPYFVNLGLKKRAVQVWRMTRDFVTKDWRSVKELYGVGKYGEDAFRMFCLGDFGVEPQDRFLKIYRAWFLMMEKNQER